MLVLLAPDDLPVEVLLREPYIRPNPMRPDSLPVTPGLGDLRLSGLVKPEEGLPVLQDIKSGDVGPQRRLVLEDPLRLDLTLAGGVLGGILNPDGLPVEVSLGDLRISQDDMRPDSLSAAVAMGDLRLSELVKPEDGLPLVLDFAAGGIGPQRRIVVLDRWRLELAIAEPRILAPLAPAEGIAAEIGVAGHLLRSLGPTRPTVPGAPPISRVFSLPAGFALDARLGTSETRERAAARGLAGETDVWALEITHPALDEPIRVVADGTDDLVNYLAPYTIEGEDYRCVAFRAAPPQQREGEIPRARLEVDNVGRDLMEWVDETDGGRGAVMRAMQISRPAAAGGDAMIVFEVTMGVGVAEATNERIQVTLSEEDLLSGPAVQMRHDPRTSPGLF